MPSTMLHVRIDSDLKARATEALDAMGLSVSDAVRILLTRIVRDQAFPLELKVPNAESRAAMREAHEMEQLLATRAVDGSAPAGESEHLAGAAPARPNAKRERARPPRSGERPPAGAGPSAEKLR
jgi:DNA-damage-inducible protein J